MPALAWILLAFASFLFQACASSDAIEKLWDDKFTATIRESGSVWLIDFYAPWCSACIQLEPLLEMAAVEAKGVLRVGKVNVDANPVLQAQYEIVRYPTLMYGRWNSRLNQVDLQLYPGDRTVDSIVKFGKRLAGAVVSNVTTEAEWDRYLSVDGSMLFLGLQSDDTKGDRVAVELQAQYQHEASQYHKHHIFVTSTSPAILTKFSRPVPFIARVDVNQVEPYYYDGELGLPTWVEKNRYPSYTSFEASNMKHIGWFRILVIGCYVPDQHDAFEAAMKKLASYSDSPLSRADRDKFAFGWLDSDKYVNYISKFFVYPEQVPTLFVWNRQDQVFYNYDGRADDVDAMAEFFINILTGKERAIAQGNYFLKIYRFMVRGYPWSLLWLFPMGFIAFFLIVGCAAVWTHDSAAEKRALTKSQEPAIRAAQPPIDAKKSE